MKRSILLLTVVLTSLSLWAVYPDKVKQQSSQEPNIAYGWNFEFFGGAGISRYAFHQLGTSYTSAHTTNRIAYPAIDAGIGINYYFLPWLGFGTGAELSTYMNRSTISTAWTQDGIDVYGERYTLTAKPTKLTEHQQIYMLEVPLLFKFRARPGVAGFTGSLGVKLGMPLYNRYNLATGGQISNEVYYPYYDLTMRNVPNVIEDVVVPAQTGMLAKTALRQFNFAAYAELGLLVRVHQRVELAITAYGNYYVTDVLQTHAATALGFDNLPNTGAYPAPYTTSYDGVLLTNEVQTLHPWSVGLKLGVQINANRTQAQRNYDREQKQLRKEQRDKEKEKRALDKQKRKEELAKEKARKKAQREADRKAREKAKKQQKKKDKAQKPEPKPKEQPKPQPKPTPTPPPVVETPVVVAPIVIVPPTDSLGSREDAIRRIREIADEYDIDICVVFCDRHDTIYVLPESKPQPDPIVQLLDVELRKSVIYFELDKTTPIIEPADVLERVADILRRHPEMRIHVNGHACKLGKAEYNQRLALRRAKAVAAKLRQLGVADNQMIIASMGEKVPYRYNGHHQLSKDRRVEIVPETRKTEIVRPGSRLAQIARRHYGNPEYWVFIYEANRDQITNPSDLIQGIELEIPDLTERLKDLSEEQIESEILRIKQEAKKQNN